MEPSVGPALLRECVRSGRGCGRIPAVRHRQAASFV